MNAKNLNRRDFLRLTGIATAGVLAAACGTQPIEPAAPAVEAPATTAPAAAEAPAAVSGLKDVPREKTLILMFGGDGTQFTDTGLGNPYAAGATHQIGSAAMWEPLIFYSAFADESIPWLATGFEYNEDFTELTINIREGVEWSDGTPFTAGDVAFTLNMLKAKAPLLSNSTVIAAWVAEATAVDDLTVHITFNSPRPRFMFTHLSFKFDTGIKIVPEHIYKDVEDVSGFKGYDAEKGLPLATGPYKIVEWTTSQKFIDRRDDWWAAKTGFAELPAVERILMIPYANETRMVQLIVNNEVDSTLSLSATTIPQAVAQNPKIITHSGRELPMGYIDWWPTSMWFNTDEGPYADKNVRWAVSYSIDREQMLDVALQGSGTITSLPFPQYPPLQPYFDAAKPLLEQYNTNEFNLDKAAERMTAAGYEKDSEGFWVKDGERIQAAVGGWQVFNDIGPVIAEQLRKGGFEAEFVTPADHGTRISDGTAKIWLNGHGGSIVDPFDTMDMYTSKYWAAAGQPTSYNSRFRNAEYDAVLEQMANMKPDANDPAYMDLYLKGIEIYLDNLVDAPIQQFLHRIPMNTTYWTNWPTAENSYVNGAFWHLTFPLMLQHLTPVA
ncbi:MAG: twin-arginine translocation signal domain-containing protein [Chloroflexi bacterium]|nr:twin-arginine translocation signal domain-containing protein [Chloroflexota bacterium]